MSVVLGLQMLNSGTLSIEFLHTIWLQKPYLGVKSRQPRQYAYCSIAIRLLFKVTGVEVGVVCGPDGSNWSRTFGYKSKISNAKSCCGNPVGKYGCCTRHPTIVTVFVCVFSKFHSYILNSALLVHKKQNKKKTLFIYSFIYTIFLNFLSLSHDWSSPSCTCHLHLSELSHVNKKKGYGKYARASDIP